MAIIENVGTTEDLKVAESRDNGIALIFLLLLLVLMIVLIDQISLRLRKRLIGAQMGN